MKTIKSSILLMAVGALFLATSCEKQLESSPVEIDNSQKATLKGYVYANTDKSKLGNEFAPVGTLVKVRIKYSDFEGNSSAKGQYVIVDTVDASGMYSVELPTDADGVTANIKGDDFVFNQIQNQTISDIIATVSTVYSHTEVPQAITPNAVIYKDLIYTSLDQADFVHNYVKISGLFTAELDSVVGADTLDKSIDIILYTTEDNTSTGDKDWSYKLTTSGSFTDVQVPINNNGSGKKVFMKYSFTYDVTVIGGKTKTQKFESTDKTLGTFTENKKDLSIDLGTGTAI